MNKTNARPQKLKQTLKPKTAKKSVPRSRKLSPTSHIVQKRELIDVITLVNNSSVFTVGAGKSNGYAVNAGSAFTFPWLSSIARCYEKYRFTSLRFDLISKNPYTHSGSIYMALDTDTNDPAPASAAAMMANQFCASCKVTDGCSLILSTNDCANLHRPMTFAYVKERNGPDPVSNVYTVARLWLGSAVAQTSSYDLYVSYTVELMNPQIVDSRPYDAVVSGPSAAPIGTTKKGFTTAGSIGLGAALLNYLGEDVIAFDVAQQRGRIMEVGAVIVNSASSGAPGDVLGPNGAQFRMDILNEAKDYLTSLYYGGTTPGRFGNMSIQSTSASPPVSPYTDGQMMGIDLASLLDAFPLSKWIVPVMIPLTSWTAAHTVRYKTEL